MGINGSASSIQSQKFGLTKKIISSIVLMKIVSGTNTLLSVVKDIEIKVLLKPALTDQINDRTLFMKGIDVSYYYQGYSQFKTGEL